MLNVTETTAQKSVLPHDILDKAREMLPCWCAINSGSAHLAGLERMAETLVETYSQLPCQVEILPLKPVEDLDGRCRELGQALRFRSLPQASRQVFLSGHYDTVFGPQHPFQKGRWWDDDTFCGPGAVDMKGGLLLLWLALLEWEYKPARKLLGWELLLVPDEEIGSPGSAPLLREAGARHTVALVFEPPLPSGDIVRRRMGSGTFQAQVTGRAVHTGRDFANGRNAIAALARFLLQVEKLNEEIPDAIFNTGFISGGGPVNIVPDQAMARFNFRVFCVDTIPVIRTRIAALVEAINREEGFRLEWKGGFNRPPKEINQGTEALFTIYCQAFQEVTGKTVGWADTGGGSDGCNLAAAGAFTLDGLGPLGGHLHTDKEFVRFSSIVERARVLSAFLEKLAFANWPGETGGS